MRYREWLISCWIVLVCAFKVRAQCSGSPEVITISTYDTGSFTYPSSGSYTENLNCAWLRNPSNSDDFLMHVSITQLRANDILTIYDGTDNMGSNLFTSSSSGTSSQSVTVVALSGNAYITFVSDGTADSNQLGFTIQYMSASVNSAGGCSSPASLTATDTTQYLTSANFPSKYSSDSNCAWSINTQDSCGSITLDFIYIDIETDCSLDKLTVTYDGSAQPDICPSSDWNSMSDFSTTGTSASINFVSDDSDEYHGFVMSYTRTGCATTTTGAASTFSNGASSAEGDNAGVIAGATVGAVASVAIISGGVVFLKLKGASAIASSLGKSGMPQNAGDVKPKKLDQVEAENGNVNHSSAPQSTNLQNRTT